MWLSYRALKKQEQHAEYELAHRHYSIVCEPVASEPEVDFMEIIAREFTLVRKLQ